MAMPNLCLPSLRLTVSTSETSVSSVSGESCCLKLAKSLPSESTWPSNGHGRPRGDGAKQREVRGEWCGCVVGWRRWRRWWRRAHLALDGGGLVELVQAAEGEVDVALGGGLLDLRAHLHLRRDLVVVGAREDAARGLHHLGHLGGHSEVGLHVLARGGVLGQGRLGGAVAALRAQRHAREGARRASCGAGASLRSGWGAAGRRGRSERAAHR